MARTNKKTQGDPPKESLLLGINGLGDEWVVALREIRHIFGNLGRQRNGESLPGSMMVVVVGSGYHFCATIEEGQSMGCYL